MRETWHFWIGDARDPEFSVKKAVCCWNAGHEMDRKHLLNVTIVPTLVSCPFCLMEMP